MPERSASFPRVFPLVAAWAIVAAAGCGTVRVVDSDLAGMPADAKTSLPSLSISYDQFSDRSIDHLELVRGREPFWVGTIRRGFEQRGRELGLLSNPTPGVPIKITITDIRLDPPGTGEGRLSANRRGKLTADVRVDKHGGFRVEADFELVGEGPGFDEFARLLGERIADEIDNRRGR